MATWLRPLVKAVMKEDFWFEAPHMAVLGNLTKRQDYLGAVEKWKLELARQRGQVLRMLCGPDQVSRKYTPLPATCAQLKQSG